MPFTPTSARNITRAALVVVYDYLLALYCLWLGVTWALVVSFESPSYAGFRTAGATPHMVGLCLMLSGIILSLAQAFNKYVRLALIPGAVTFALITLCFADGAGWRSSATLNYGFWAVAYLVMTLAYPIYELETQP